MQVLGCQGGHDASVVAVHDGRLVSVVEAEQDSFPRYSNLNPFQLLVGLEQAHAEPPDAICLPGWVKGFFSRERQTGIAKFAATGYNVAWVRAGSVMAERNAH